MESLFQNLFNCYCFLFLLLFVIFFFCVIFLRVQLSRRRKCRNALTHFDYTSLENQEYLVGILKKLAYFQILDEILASSSQEQKEIALTYLKPVLLKLEPYIRKSSIGYQVFFLTFLAKYPILLEGKNNLFITYVVECTISDSFHMVDKSFLVLNRFGNSELIKKALLLMSQKGIVHHPKLIMNSLLKFQGNFEVLKDFLVKDLKKYMKYMQVACIDFFGYKKLDVCEILFPMMQDKKEDKEVRIACIRYFGQMKYKPAVKELYQFLKEDVSAFEYAAVAAKSLKKYPSKETTNHLLEALGSYSWYVRNNAAESIIRINDADVVRKMLRQIGDKYAYEALVYQRKLQEREK